ncbi:TetR/AcrR family transcriptional regulator [Actinomadura gamaensis]|uniref:TetR/AcrR family transcriptional regulator n=1 Tax=Actinomadura gamaensis TaxID=1763541 RepID=A0ABV9U048_9ACTN
MTETETMGRRERKKAATRRALADAALKLFLERGYDAVGVREIAEAADVSVTTLFKHFPDGKEALLFDQDADREAMLVRAVRDRPAGTSVPGALLDLLRDERAERMRKDPAFEDFLRLIESTPALREYSRRMWLRHETALAEAIASESGLPASDPACLGLAHFALEAAHLARLQDDYQESLARIFALLENGWTALATQSTGHS